MDDATREALLGSIEKWEGIVAGTGEDKGVLNCPLCTMYYHGGCEGCPVAEKVENILCCGTPYENYVRACIYADSTPEKITAAAEAELAFLQSLLPPESRE